MFKKTVILCIIFSIYSIIPGSATDTELLPLVNQYYDNKFQLANLSINKTQLENSVVDLNESIIKLEEQIEKIDNNINIFTSEIDALEITIQDNKDKKNETEWKMKLINVLNDRESIFLLGILIGAVAGLWIISSILVLLWRR